jgi:hypothetical protein
MRSIERMMVTLTLVSVILAGLGPVGQSQERAAGADSGTGHLIWGATGVPGVTLQGLPRAGQRRDGAVSRASATRLVGHGHSHQTGLPV